ncbi:DUF2268 domain-containing protein [Bacillus spongiae]|uniref:DUF2268 domain-containing protein n=1 Tax=Bacillus spongiae TaxID=2683610 RepID=A0ABU8HBJ1_9BACI
MSVIPTNKLLKKHGESPEKLLASCGVNKDEARSLYTYLKGFGMYSRTTGILDTVDELIEKEYWTHLEKIEKKYKKKWRGPNVPIMIFPLDQRREGKMSGVSFKDKIFLFLTPSVSRKKLEALFIHEYHHCVRMNKLLKVNKEFTLLDSIVFEGLAESAVKEYCGEEYIADWCKKYKQPHLQRMWNTSIKPNLDAKKGERVHESLLFGKGFAPRMMGYAVGYYLIQQWLADHPASTVKMLSLPSETFILKEEEKS